MKLSKHTTWIALAAVSAALGIAYLFGKDKGGDSTPSVHSKAVTLAKAVVPSSDGDEAYELVTQGRQRDSRYSSCADLVNYVLHAIGAPPEAWNRNDPDMGTTWVPGVNISKPVAWARHNGAWVPYEEGKVPQPGDLVLIGQGMGEHMFVFLGADGDTWSSADYGQAGHTSAFRERVLSNGHLGDRPVIGWIDVEKAVSVV